jgi:hypothetical protein
MGVACPIAPHGWNCNNSDPYTATAFVGMVYIYIYIIAGWIVPQLDWRCGAPCPTSSPTRWKVPQLDWMCGAFCSATTLTIQHPVYKLFSLLLAKFATPEFQEPIGDVRGIGQAFSPTRLKISSTSRVLTKLFSCPISDSYTQLKLEPDAIHGRSCFGPSYCDSMHLIISLHTKVGRSCLHCCGDFAG